MDWLDKELSQALERKEPSPDFAARLNARIEAERTGTPLVERPRPKLFRLPRWIPAAAALLLIAGSGGVAWRRHEGMLAKDQVMLAMRITAGKLNHVQTHMREAEQ